MKISFIKDDVVKLYHECNDIEVLKKALMDMRNEVIRLKLYIEDLETRKSHAVS